ncbi:hypothetical protein GCM10027049_21100 [Mucilaginibacter puniceus]
MKQKNLILTIMHGYDYPFVEPFINSLNNTGYTDDLVIFTSNNISKTTKKKLIQQGAILIEFSSVYPFIKNYAKSFEDIDPAITINNYRFILFLHFLKETQANYKNIMLTDIRDVIFQKLPFNGLDEKIYLFLEDQSQTFKNSELNFNWLSQAGGKEFANSVLNEVVSCAGVVIGGTSHMIKYLEFIKNNLKFREKPDWGLDQGIHNFYAYHDKPENLKLIPNNTPMVLTLGACNTYNLNQAGLLTNTEGHVYPIIHQYDRIEELFMYFKKKYIGNRVTQILKRLFYKLLP